MIQEIRAANRSLKFIDKNKFESLASFLSNYQE